MKKHSISESTDYYYESYYTNNDQYYYLKKNKKKNKGEKQKLSKKYSTEYTDDKKTEVLYDSSTNWKRKSTFSYADSNGNKKSSNREKKYYIIKEIEADNKYSYSKPMKNNSQNVNEFKLESEKTTNTSSNNSITENSFNNYSAETKKPLRKINSKFQEFSGVELEKTKNAKSENNGNNRKYNYNENGNDKMYLLDLTLNAKHRHPDENCSNNEIKSKENSTTKVIYNEDNKIKLSNEATVISCGFNSTNAKDSIMIGNYGYFHSKSNDLISTNLNFLNENPEKSNDILNSLGINPYIFRKQNSENLSNTYVSSMKVANLTNLSYVNNSNRDSYGGMDKESTKIDQFKLTQETLKEANNSNKCLKENTARKISLSERDIFIPTQSVSNSTSNRPSSLIDLSISTSSLSSSNINNNDNSITNKPKLRPHNSTKQNYNKFNLSDPNNTVNNDLLQNPISTTNPTEDLLSNNLYKEIYSNTEILALKLKLNKEEEAKIFLLSRYDNLNQKMKSFCEMNKIDKNFIKPLEQTILKALSNIYITYNTNLNERNTKYLKWLNVLWNSSSKTNVTYAEDTNSEHCEDQSESDIEKFTSLSCFTDHYDSDLDKSFDCDSNIKSKFWNEWF